MKLEIRNPKQEAPTRSRRRPHSSFEFRVYLVILISSFVI